MSEYSLEGVLIKSALLVLEDGTQFHGRAIGATGSAVGEVVFNTSMTGYQEILTDPSYSRQIVTLTYPHIGNVGTNDADEESSQVHAQGLVIRDLPLIASNFRNTEDLSSYLKRHNIVAIADIDTRKLTRLLREKGAQNGCIIAGDNPDAALALEKARAFPGLNGMDLAKEVTTAEPYSWTQGSWTLTGGLPEAKKEDELPFHVVAYDFGAKRNILRMLVDRGCRLTIVPAQTSGVEFYSNLNGVFFKDLKLADPDIFMEAVGDDLGATMGNIIDKSYKVMVETKPDAVLVLGDTNSCLSVIGAKRLHIPIFHMEAGNRCKDECLPEETNRRIVDIISDVNMAYSEHARRYLADCGLPKERTYVTGSPMAEVLHQNLAEIEASDIHAKLGLEKGKYILLSAHREENIDTEKNFMSLFTAINKMAEKYDMPILYSCHPRSRKRLEASGFQLDKRVIQHEPLGFHDYNCLQMNAFAVVSDSGTLPEESSFFTSVGHPFPAICIRTSTERPEALDKACFFIAGIDEKSLLQAVDTAVTMNQNGDYGIPVPDYIEENVSTKVVKIIQSYTGIVNRMVWRKS